MERNEISEQETRLFCALRNHGATWITSRELAKQAKVAERTARAHLLKFVKLNIVDLAEVFPGHRYRLAEKADKRNGSYITRLMRAADVFGFK